MTGRHHKFEDPERLEELDPEGTLRRFGLKDGETVCDIGAGTGVFSFPAAALTKGKVYALDIDEGMLEAIRKKVERNGVSHVIPVRGDGKTLSFPDRSMDLVLMVTVLHHIGDKPAMLAEVRRVLNRAGRFGVIEFHDKETPLGPPVGHRIGKEEVLETLRRSGFEEVEGFDLGENFYAKLFRVAGTDQEEN